MKYTQRYLLVVAFVSGLSIMSAELTLGRLLAPYFGSSIYVWTSVIGLVLVAMSLGYWYGGRLADRNPRLEILLIALLAAAALFVLAAFALKPVAILTLWVLSLVRQAALLALLGSLIVTAILFAIPLGLMATTSPFLIRLLSRNLKDVGETAGKVFAVSTIGSIIGTFLPALVFIPSFGSRQTILLSAVLLGVIAAWGLARSARVLTVAFVILMGLVPIPMISRITMRDSSDLLADAESSYNYIRVTDVGDIRFMKLEDGRGVQSMYAPDKYLFGAYYDYLAATPLLRENSANKRALNVLVLGLAGGTVARAMEHYLAPYYDLSIDGVEIDPKVAEVGAEYFGLKDLQRLKTHALDGRVFLARSSKHYDVIIIDVYTNELAIPFHLATREFFKLVSQRLAPDGIVAMNVAARSENSRLVSAILDTVADVFPYTARFQVPTTQSYLIIAANSPLPQRALAGPDELRVLAEQIITDAQTTRAANKKAALTDDRAPVEFLTDLW